MAETDRIQLILDAQDNMSKTLDEVNKKLGSVEKSAQKAETAFFDLGGTLMKYFSGAAILNAFKFVIKGTAEAEVAVNKLKTSVEIAGGSWWDVGNAMQVYATKLAQTTTYTDEDVMTSMKTLIMITGDTKKSWEQASLAMDLASARGMSLEQSSRLIGMAMTGNIEMLRRFIPDLKSLSSETLNTMTSTEKATYALDALRKQVGGTASKEVDTLAGQYKILWNNIGEVAEAMGGSGNDGAKELTKSMNELLVATLPVIKAYGEFNSTLMNLAIQGIKIVYSAIYDKLTPATEALGGILGKIGQGAIKGWEEIRQLTGENIEGFYQGSMSAQQFLGMITGINTETMNWERVSTSAHEKSKAQIEAEKKAIEDKARREKEIYQEADKAYRELVDKKKKADEEMAKNTKQTASLMSDAFMASATGSEEVFANLAKNVSDTLLTQMFSPMAKGLNDMLGQFGEIGTMVAGGVGGVVGGILGGFLNTMFAQSKTTAEYTQEAYDEMVKKTNAKLDEIGMKKTEVSKAVDIVEALGKDFEKYQRFSASSQSEAIMKATGVNIAGKTKGEALQALYGKMGGLSSEYQVKQGQMSDIRAYMMSELSGLDAGFTAYYRNKLNAGQMLSESDLGGLATIKGGNIGERLGGYMGRFRQYQELLSQASLDLLNQELERTQLGNTLKETPSYAGGGIMAKTGLAFVHKGERITNRDELSNYSTNGGTVINISDGAFILNGINWSNEEQKKQVAKDISEYISAYTNDQIRLSRGGMRSY